LFGAHTLFHFSMILRFAFFSIIVLERKYFCGSVLY
jgi:hypothetical protein